MIRPPRLALAFLGLLLPGMLAAEASGPDFFRVVDVAPGSVLNMRAGPGMERDILGTVPAEADGLANLGCIGGLSLTEWETATEEERAASRMTRWCLVGHDRLVGWVAGWHVGEGGLEDGFRAGGRLTQLAGSEWQLTRLGNEEITADSTLSFGADGALGGLAACNRMIGDFTQDGGMLTLGPLGTTRMLCDEPLMTLEFNVTTALDTVTRAVAHHLVLALLDTENTLVAQYRRLDAD